MNFLFNAENWLLEVHFSPLAVLTLPHHQMWNILQNLLDAKNDENENINMHKEEKEVQEWDIHFTKKKWRFVLTSSDSRDNDE